MYSDSLGISPPCWIRGFHNPRSRRAARSGFLLKSMDIVSRTQQTATWKRARVPQKLKVEAPGSGYDGVPAYILTTWDRRFSAPVEIYHMGIFSTRVLNAHLDIHTPVQALPLNWYQGMYLLLAVEMCPTISNSVPISVPRITHEQETSEGYRLSIERIYCQRKYEGHLACIWTSPQPAFLKLDEKYLGDFPQVAT